MKKIVVLILIFCFSFTVSIAQDDFIDLNGVFTGKYRYENKSNLRWRPNTNQYTYYDTQADIDGQIISVDMKNGKETVLFSFKDFLKKNNIDSREQLKSQNMELSSGIQWSDQNTFSFTFKKDDNYYWVNYHLKNGTFEMEDANMLMEATDASDDYKLFIFNDNGLVSVGKTGSDKRYIICPDTGENIVFGEAVHRSEWGIGEGYYFSPKSNYIAFYRMDESMVEDYPLLHTDGTIATIETIKYPMAGRTSHQVKVGIFDVNKSFQEQKTVYHYILTDVNDGEFLTNVTFSPDEKYLYITHLNREQNHSKLIRYDVQNGKKLQVLIEETDDRYVEPQTRMTFLKNGNFLWQSDRDGWNHFYLYDFNGNLIKQVTTGKWEVIENLGVDSEEQNLFFMTNKDLACDKYLYSINLKTGKLINHTPKSGTHNILFSPDKKYYFDYYTSLHTPRDIYANSTSGQQRLILSCPNPYAAHPLGTDTIFTLKNSKSGIDLFCEMILPPHFDKNKKYPCLVYVYGGPHSQLVTNSFMNAGVFLNYMAEKGYVIFIMDNRGTNHRGADFEKCIHRQLGVLESEDQMVGIDHLRSLPFIDTKRMGIDGWSFGGFMTLTMITEHPEIFRSATCGGPVVNWEWYEVMYGERYMDTPQENPEGYAHANIIPKIKNLKCPLLIMHGQQDHTVVQQQSLELLHQSVKDDVQIQYFPYTTHDHNVIGKERVQMWHKIEQFHDQYLMK